MDLSRQAYSGVLAKARLLPFELQNIKARRTELDFPKSKNKFRNKQRPIFSRSGLHIWVDPSG